MDFELIGNITAIETIAVGRGIRDRRRLQRIYGKGRCRKLRGIATLRLADGTIHTAEVPWVRGAWNRTEGLKLETKVPSADYRVGTEAETEGRLGYEASQRQV